MQIKLAFLGAAQNVTGSRFLVETDDAKVLVDCGLYQERQFRSRNWDPFPVPPDTLDGVLLTHAHLDHCGLLPKLVREGFRGKIFCTAATAEITRIVLMDSAHIQEEDAKYKKKRHRREKRKGRYPEVPLYTVKDAAASLARLSPVKYARPTTIAKGMEATFHCAGHILGAAAIKLELQRNGEKRTILFSGDVGPWDAPILRDPVLIDQADYVLIESTYGDRVHESPGSAKDNLCESINQTIQDGGNIVIPSFALERSQDLLYRLNELLLENRIPHLMTFMDSPMAISVTEVFEDHPELFDEEMIEHVNQQASPFNFRGLKMTRSARESKAINHIKGTVVVIAGSGMCTGGRIKHHLVNNIARPESTILFVGYQAAGTLGRRIVDGAEEVRILGRTRAVRAKIARIHGFSAHADRDGLLRWLSGLRTAPRGVFVVHGESDSARHFRDFIHQKTGWNISVPAYGDEVILD